MPDIPLMSIRWQIDSVSTPPDLFSALAPFYGNRIYAFNHFTVSETPEKNAEDLLAGLPKQATFDVVTRSRGGLVLFPPRHRDPAANDSRLVN